MGLFGKPISWMRNVTEWLDGKPKYQWTLGSNPLLGEKSIMTANLSRGGRIVERLITIGGTLALLYGGPFALPWITGAGIGQALFNIKMNGIICGWATKGLVYGANFCMQVYDQCANGTDESRESAKYAKMMKKNQIKQGGVTPTNVNIPQVDRKPSVIDRMIAVGNAFNGRAGAPQQGWQNTVIWGDNNNNGTSGAPQPGNGQKYEEAFQVPSEDTVRVASSGREGAWQHNHHVGSSAPEPVQHHYEPPPPAPYKPPGCDNN